MDKDRKGEERRHRVSLLREVTFHPTLVYEAMAPVVHHRQSPGDMVRDCEQLGQLHRKVIQLI